MSEVLGGDARIVWFNGQFLDLDEVKISPFDRGFLFADGVYEAVRWVPARDGAEAGILALDRHLRRLKASLDTVRMDRVDLESFGPALVELIERNGLRDSDATMYLQVTRGVAPRTHVFPDPPVTPTVFAIARAFDPPREQWEKGVEVSVVEDLRWGRCDIKSISLLPNVLASEEARQRGGSEALFVRDGIITEGAHTAVVAVIDGGLVAHPDGRSILPSVTRDLVFELAASAGILVEYRPLTRDELFGIDELMILGTATEVTPVVRIDGEVVGTGRPGPVTRQLQAAFARITP